MSQPTTPLDQPEPLLPEISVQLFDAGHSERDSVEGFIRTVFQQTYQAEVNHFLPLLISMQRKGKVEAALGIAAASEHTPLFLECYLDSPIEQMLAEQRQRPISRNKIVEVGNLAAVPPGAARYLFIALTAYLKGAGIDWAVFTAVPRVVNSFAKMDITLQTLAKADIERLPEPRDNWGRYYDNAPQVVVAEVAHSAERICHLLARMNSTALQQLWEMSLQAGKQSRQKNSAQSTII